MMLDKEEIEHLAKLAKLELTEIEKEKLIKDLSAILDYAAKLKEVDTSGIEPTAYALGLKNVMREDVASQKEASQTLIQQAKELKDNYIKTKAIFLK